MYNASSIPSALMFAASNEQDFLCRVFGRTLCGDQLDREVGDLIASPNPLPGGRIPGPVHPKLFTYMRYNAELTTAGLSALGVPSISPEHVQQMDSVDHILELQEVGKAVAKSQGQERALRRISVNHKAHKEHEGRCVPRRSYSDPRWRIRIPTRSDVRADAPPTALRPMPSPAPGRGCRSAR